LKDFDNQLLIEQEHSITTFLNDKGVEVASERERVLTRHLASVFLANRFESIYHGIFGSQLKALAMLNAAAPKGTPIAAMEAWYEVGKAQFPLLYGEDGEYTFVNWLGYMRRVTLIMQVDENIHITLFGNEFLKYMIQQSYSLEKIG
jgi:hypothetical protein